MCSHPYKPYQLALLIKKSLDDVTWALSRVPVKPLYHTSIKIFISPVFMLYLQKVLLIHLKTCVFYITFELKLPLHVSFKTELFPLSIAA